MRESTRRLLLDSTVTDIEDREDSTTFYLVSEEGKDYAVEVQSGEVIVRPLGETEESEGDDLAKAIAYFVREIDLLKERVTELELEAGANS